jgi:nucleoside-diphosphate-sugar epimerase
MKIFLTGGTGFIGGHFLKQGLAAGYEIRALRRAGSNTRIPLTQEPDWLEVPFEELEPDHFGGCEIVVHLAAHSANVPYDSLENCLHWNVTIPLRLADRAVEAGLKRFVVAGSCFEYGLAGERYDFIPIDAPLEPTQSYPISKAAASVAWGGFARERNVHVDILRVFQAYGEGEQEGRLWPMLRANALSGRDHLMTLGEQVRDFVPVEEVAKQFLFAVKSGAKSGFNIRHVGSGKSQTVAAFSQTVWREYNATGQLKLGALPYRKNDAMRYVPKI